jgi:nitrous oxidase accessory protein
VVTGNVMRGARTAQSVSGNGIHIWSSERVEVAHNTVSGHRDGIYFEFVKSGYVHDNTSEQSARYGMHFMFSDDCRYERNLYRENGNGVAVMYSKRVVMTGNRFVHNWGSAAYGLLLKDISDSRVAGNDFTKNSVGLYLEDSNRNLVLANRFRENGWALKVMANAQGNTFEHNTFELNAFDVATNSRSNFSTFNENYWERYRGYDLDRNGIGDVPHAPVRLFALVVEQSPPTIILLRSLLVDLLDLAERILPTLTPATLLDHRPLMKRPAPGAAGG